MLYWARSASRKSQRGPRSRSLQYRGVTFYGRTSRWESHIWDCGKQVYLGGFDIAHAAVRIAPGPIVELVLREPIGSPPTCFLAAPTPERSSILSWIKLKAYMGGAEISGFLWKVVRNKRKCVTVVKGLELFGVKLSDVSKKLGKKFATRASVVKGPTEKEQIDVQGDISYHIILWSLLQIHGLIYTYLLGSTRPWLLDIYSCIACC